MNCHKYDYILARTCTPQTSNFVAPQAEELLACSSAQVHPHLTQIIITVHYQAWKDQLQLQHDPVFTHYILEGLQSGFRIAISPGIQLQLAKSNMQ